MSSWTISQVKEWACDEVGIDEEDAVRLEVQKIDGKALLKMTEEKLESYGIPGGPATNLYEAIQQLKQQPGTSLCSFLPIPHIPSLPFLLTLFQLMMLSPDFGRPFLLVKSN
ncbi:MAG: hypothetical protein KAG66_09595 [Methylococcales bacterium]|nr:hypothetical protein [Methylococcales bacterium]